MTTRNNLPFSASVTGRGVRVKGASLDEATLIHVNKKGSQQRHIVRLFASNASDTTDRKLWILFGKKEIGSAIVATIPAKQGLFAVIPDFGLGPDDAFDCGVWAFVESDSDTDKISIFGTYDAVDA